MRRFLATLGGLLLAIFAWLATLGTAIGLYGASDRAVESDCAIVLGAAAYGNRPSPVFEERIRHGIALYRTGLVSKIIFTGGYGTGAPRAESEVAAAYAVREGVPEADILVELRSRTTQQNLAEAKILMESNGLRTAILVSDPLHMRRAIWMAKDLDIPAVSSPTPTTRYRSFNTQFRFLRRELYYWHHYLFTGG
ncbi:MAG: YdcF family protein [Kiritimatiellia bacterium]